MVIADPLALVRGVHFAATLLVSGTVCFMTLVMQSRLRMRDFAILRRRMTVTVWIGVALGILTGAIWLVWLAANVLGEPLLDVCLHGGALSVLVDTRFGWICCARLLLAVLLGFLVLNSNWRLLQITTATAFLVLPAFIGHAGASAGRWGDVHLVSDAAHLMAAGVWLGGLPAFVLLLWTTRQKGKGRWYELATEATRRFSVLAAISVGVLLASGIVNSWSLLGSLRDLWTTDYGRLVAFKIILLGAMTAIACVNKFRLTPRLPDRAALRDLQRNSLAEIAIGACVLIVVGFLGQMQPTAHVHAAPTAIPPGAAFTHIHAPEAMADVTIDPGRVGQTMVTIRVSREDFTAFAAKQVRLELDPPGAAGRPLERDAELAPDGTWLVKNVLLTAPGIWGVRVNVIAQSGKTILLDAPVVIER
jgi:putative copper export protein